MSHIPEVVRDRERRFGIRSGLSGAMLRVIGPFGNPPVGGGTVPDNPFGTSQFFAPLADLGSGAVNTTLVRGSGSATFARATEAAARLSTGLWKLDVASGTARSHYLSDLSYGGFLTEGAATQILTAPRDMTNAAWVKVDVAAAQTSTGIDGGVNSCTRITANGLGAGTILQTITAAASSRTYSCFIKRVTGTGTVGICQDGVTFTDITSLINTSTFTLVQLNTSQLNAVIGIQLGTTTDAIDVDCNQFETGGFATTPIPAAGTRNADVLSYPFAGNFSQSNGTTYVEVSDISTSGIIRYGLLDTANGHFFPAFASNTVASIFDGTNTVTISGLTSKLNAVQKVASSWGPAGLSVTGNGLTPITGSFDGSIGGVAALGVGGVGDASDLYGTVKNIHIWTQKFSDVQLQAFTA